MDRVARPPAVVPVLAVGVLAGAVVVGLMYGTASREADTPALDLPAIVSPVSVRTSSPPG
jgi:hypothetical protein